MNSLKLKIILICLVLITRVVASDLLVRPSDKGLIEIGPRKTATTFFRITNQGADDKEIFASSQLPAGWKQIIQEFPFVMDGNSTQVRLFSFFVPPSTSAGLYEIKYAAQDRKTLSTRDETTIQVQVLPVHEIDIIVIESPQYVIEDKDYRVLFEVINKSNFSDRIELQAQTSEQSSVFFNKKIIELRPGERDTINTTFSTHLAKSTSMKNHIQLIGSSNTTKEIIYKKILVQVIPKKQEKNKPFHTLPVKMSIRRVFQQNGAFRSGYQGEVYAKGSLDEKKTKNIEARFRGPDIYSESFLAAHDEYFVNYSNQTFQFKVGDGYYSLTQLTERIRYGRGFFSSAKLNNFQLAGYYQQTRWLRPKEKQIGAYVRYSFLKNSFIGLNLLHKKRAIDASIMSIESAIKPNRFNDIEIEIASASSANEFTNSYRSKLRGQLRKLNYLFEYIHADPNFPGYYRDTRYITSGASFKVTKYLHIGANIRHEKQNFDIDSTHFSAPISHFEQIGFHIRPFKQTSINLDYVQRSRKDRLDIPKFDYDEKTGRLGLSQIIGPVTFYSSAEYGNTWNNLTDGNHQMKRFTFSSTFRFRRKNSIRSYFYMDDNQRYNGENRTRYTAGVTVQQYFGQFSFLNLSYQNNYAPEDYFRDRNLFNVKLVHRLPFGHEISITGRHTLLRNTLHDKESALLLDYSVPLDMNVSRNSESNLIYGKIFDRESSQPIPNIYIKLNDKPVLSDKDGKFSFSNVKPGKYFIYLDESQLEFGKITIPKLPFGIELVGGQKEYLEIAVTHGASINGKITNADKNLTNQTLVQSGPKNGKNVLFGKGSIIDQNSDMINGMPSSPLPMGFLSDSPGLESIYVELVCDNGKKQMFTNKYGAFYFEGLEPGDYSIIVHENNLPDYHYFKKKLYTFSLKPGDSEKIVIQAFAKKRSIMFAQKKETALAVKEEKNGNLKNSTFTKRLLKEVEKNSQNVLPTNVDFILGMSYYRIKQYFNALNAFKNARETSVEKPDILLMLGLTHSKMGDKKSATELFQYIIDHGSASLAKTIALGYLGYLKNKRVSTKAYLVHFNNGVSYFKNLQYKSAAEAFSKAIYSTNDQKEKAEGYYSLGKSLYALEKYFEAKTVLNKAINLGPESICINALFASGQCYFQLNKFDIAKEQFLKVAILSSDKKIIHQARDYLAKIYSPNYKLTWLTN
jgi:tetratricopeptide (TPR) repeat protein